MKIQCERQVILRLDRRIELKQAEIEVYQAATQNVKTSSAREIASKMEGFTFRIQRAELDRLFF